MKLKDQVAVITGGNSGIGRAIARKFRHEGAKVVVFGRNADTLQDVGKELGGDTLTVRGDVSKVADLERLFSETTNRFGKIHVLVANAGIGGGVAPFHTTSEDLFDQISAINFKGPYFTVQKALPHFADHASIILTGSALARKTTAGMSAYSATKAAVGSLSKTLAVELAPRGIRVNCISPGPIETPIFGEAIQSEESKSKFVKYLETQVPMKRFGQDHEIAQAAVFLCSKDSSYVTGADLFADGGFTA